MSRELIYSLEPSTARCANTYDGDEIETKDDRKGRGLDCKDIAPLFCMGMGTQRYHTHITPYFPMFYAFPGCGRNKLTSGDILCGFPSQFSYVLTDVSFLWPRPF